MEDYFDGQTVKSALLYGIWMRPAFLEVSTSMRDIKIDYFVS